MTANKACSGLLAGGVSAVLSGYLLACAILALWGVDHWLCMSATPYYKWEQLPYLFYRAEGVATPAATNEIRRGSDAARFLDEIRKTMITADAVSQQMVYEYHRQAVDGIRWSASPASKRAEEKMSELRSRVACDTCPTQCVQTAKAVQRTLEESERFFRVSGRSGRGFSGLALARTRRAYKKQSDICAGLCVKPEAPSELIREILSTDCVALARAVNDWPHRCFQIEEAEWYGGAGGPWSEEMTTSRKFYQANHETPYLRALWLLLDGEEYSPFLAAAFICWRSDVQANYFGMSEWAEIPNEFYNQVRFKALCRVKDFLQEHPDNQHALAQKEVLLGVPNVRRGTLYGNACFYAGVWL